MTKQNYLDIIERLTDDAVDKLGEAWCGNTLFNKAAFSLANSWRNAGGDQESYVAAVSAYPLGLTYPRSDLERRLANTFDDTDDGTEFDRVEGAGRSGTGLETLHENVEVSPEIPARVKRTALALVARAIQVGTWTPTATSRQLALITGDSHVTAAEHMDVFRELGFVKAVEWSAGGFARRYVLDKTWDKPNMNCPREYMLSSSHLLWSGFPSALGWTAYRVFTRTPLEPSTKAAIARCAKADPATVRKHLSPLVAHGLVIEEGRKYRRNPDVSAALLDAVAGRLGVVAERDERAALYEAQSGVWAEARRDPRFRWKWFAYGGGRDETVRFVMDYCYGLSKSELCAKLARNIGGSVYAWGEALARPEGLGRMLADRRLWREPVKPRPNPFQDRWPDNPVWPEEANGFIEGMVWD